MNLLEQLPKTVGSYSIEIDSREYLEIKDSGNKRLYAHIITFIALLSPLISIGYAIYYRRPLLTIELFPAWLLLFSGITSILGQKFIHEGALLVSITGEILVNPKEPGAIDTIRQIETRKKRFATKVVIRGHKYEHDIAQFSKQEDADKVRNIIDEFITQNRD